MKQPDFLWLSIHIIQGTVEWNSKKYSTCARKFDTLSLCDDRLLCSSDEDGDFDVVPEQSYQNDDGSWEC